MLLLQIVAGKMLKPFPTKPSVKIKFEELNLSYLERLATAALINALLYFCKYAIKSESTGGS